MLEKINRLLRTYYVPEACLLLVLLILFLTGEYERLKWFGAFVAACYSILTYIEVRKIRGET